jgi:uncharacterized membrane protein YsdA (DUF1294 family)
MVAAPRAMRDRVGAMLIWPLVAFGLSAVNIATFALFAFDKRQARIGGRRIPERTLLIMAAIGGSPGALAAQQILRHKTRKQPFGARLATIVGVQAVGLALILSRLQA